MTLHPQSEASFLGVERRGDPLMMCLFPMHSHLFAKGFGFEQRVMVLIQYANDINHGQRANIEVPEDVIEGEQGSDPGGLTRLGTTGVNKSLNNCIVAAPKTASAASSTLATASLASVSSPKCATAAGGTGKAPCCNVKEEPGSADTLTRLDAALILPS